MESAQKVRDIFKEYSGVIDESLRTLFGAQPDLNMYKHLAYFMGFLDEDLKPIEGYGGKRFRSSLALMLADWYGNKEAGLPAALSVELFHNFTLIHDDIFDEDTLRRGRKTVWNVWGRDNAINSGDAQFLLASQVLVDAYKEGVLTNYEVHHYLNEQFLKVLEGQYLDFLLTESKLGDAGVHETAYMDTVVRKTSDLISAATKGAGLAAGISQKEADALYTLGQEFGIAYQMCDDTVSIWGSKEATGKRAFGDILEKKKTLPVLYAYSVLDEKGKMRLTALYNSDDELSLSEANEVVALLDSVETYEYMQKKITEHARATKDVVATLTLPKEKQNMLCEIVEILLPDAKRI